MTRESLEGLEGDPLGMLWDVLEDAPEAILVTGASESRYLYANACATQLLGMTSEEIVSAGHGALARWCGKPDLESPAAMSRVIEESPATLTEEFEVTAGTRRGLRLEFARRAVRLGDRWIVIVKMRDVTELRRSDMHHAQMQMAVNEAADGIYVIDPESVEYVDVNEAAARLMGVDRETLLARGLGWILRRSNVTPDQQREVYRDLIARHPEVVSRERRIPWPDGSWITIETTRRAVLVHDRWLIVSVARDTTARTRAQEEARRHMEELARSNQELQQFAYVTSHDLSEPLRMIASYAQLLERRHGPKLDEDARDFIQFIVEGARRMKMLIDSILVYSRAGRGAAGPVPVKLEHVLDEALANLSQAIAESNAIVRRGSLPVVPGEPVALMQLMQNLVGNAIKFRGTAPPEICIDAAELQGEWEVTVADNGIGIAPQYFERIFVIFQRLHSREAYDGAGVGLSICKKIVERLGGRIWVQSNPDAGTTFHFTLPKDLRRRVTEFPVQCPSIPQRGAALTPRRTVRAK